MRPTHHPSPSTPTAKIRKIMCKTLKGPLWACKLARCGRGRGRGGALCLLMVGAVVCLLLPALTPHPSPAETRRPLRRIHQEEEDYTAPKPRPPRPHNPIATPTGRSAGVGVVVTSLMSNLTTGVLKSQSQSTPAAPSRDVTTKGFTKTEGTAAQQRAARVALARAQETALNAMQFGYKLSAAQKKMMEKLTPQAKKLLEEKLAKTRMAQDRIYLSQLRVRKQVVARPGGGEQIVSTANRTVRFPAMLKKLPLAQWPQEYSLYYNLTHYPWVRSRGCERFNTVFRPPATLPQRGLASFPSSGNTWARYLIEGATGIFTGSMYDDTSLMTKGLYGEGLVHDSGMTILQKSHGYTTGEAMTMDDRQQRAQHNHLQELGGRGVVVVRNPFKALISHRHLDVGGHTGYAPKAHFLGQGWADFVRLKVRLWRDFYEDWVRLTTPDAIYVTHYEDLREDPVGEMRGVLGYLGIKEDPSRLACLGRNLDGLFKRKPKRNLQLNFDPFTEELRGYIYEAIGTVDEALKERGKVGLPLSKYEIYDGEEAEAMRRQRLDGGDGGGGDGGGDGGGSDESDGDGVS